MFNLIKMDLYRLFHSVSAWIILLCALLTAVFSIAMTNMDIQASKEEEASAEKSMMGIYMTVEEKGADEAAENSSAEPIVGIYVTGNEEWANGKIELGDVISMEVQSGLTAILCVIFAALFANADQKNGYIKNIAGQFPRRGKLILSKFFATALQVFLLLFIFAAATAMFSFIFWGDRVEIGSWMSLAKALGVQYLLHLGIAVLTMFLTILARSNALGITAGILICSGLTAYFYVGINQIVSTLKPGWDFDINRYVLESNMKMISANTAPDEMLRAAVVGIAFVVIFAALAMAVMKKRDIR